MIDIDVVVCPSVRPAIRQSVRQSVLASSCAYIDRFVSASVCVCVIVVTFCHPSHHIRTDCVFFCSCVRMCYFLFVLVAFSHSQYHRL